MPFSYGCSFAQKLTFEFSKRHVRTGCTQGHRDQKAMVHSGEFHHECDSGNGHLHGCR